MHNDARDLSRRLSGCALAVCEHYLSNGRRSGRYWHVGDVFNSPGRSLFVRLAGPSSGPGAAGKWTDAATGEHGDLLDLIQAQRNHQTLSETLAEARSFLGFSPSSSPPAGSNLPPPARGDGTERARRLFLVSRPVSGTLAERFLRTRGITLTPDPHYLRFADRCFVRPSDDDAVQHWPALIAAVRNPAGHLLAVQRTYLARDGRGKAPFEEPRRALGPLLGHSVHLGRFDDIAAIGEGIETMLSIATAFPRLPTFAALTAAHLSAFIPPPSLRTLYIAADRGPAGVNAAERLTAQLAPSGIAVGRLDPTTDDWNGDLLQYGAEAAARRLYDLLQPVDRLRLYGQDPSSLTLGSRP